MAKEPTPVMIDGGPPAWPLMTALLLVLAVMLGLLFYDQPVPPRDDTDPIGGRSNMSILTDARTGCQYLTTHRGGITPRLDAEHNQICE